MWRYWSGLGSWKFLVTNFFSSFILLSGNFSKTGLRQLKISRHSLFFFFFFFYPLLTYYLARDSCKKWQEIIGKAGLISQIEQLQIFLVTIFLCSLFLGNSVFWKIHESDWLLLHISYQCVNICVHTSARWNKTKYNDERAQHAP